jgi:hypothetical protein
MDVGAQELAGKVCSACGFSLEMPKDWDQPYWFVIKANGGRVLHDWCWSTHPQAKLTAIERMAQAAWDAGL